MPVKLFAHGVGVAGAFFGLAETARKDVEICNQAGVDIAEKRVADSLDRFCEPSQFGMDRPEIAKLHQVGDPVHVGFNRRV